ncbi:MFS transporter [Proteus myxofaciens]|uniref:Major facilitator superfamily protein n=1 Tax=Proteus myxofaciens ATCC 19692 TaxID=1354337 RepID=A0A198FJ91_9GAMM|nr:MFS transporter [Proteus myxofaciens]OAT24271.1 major facilitator superfamily protein [Proteus myxofaciens ATCC 19692]
MTYRYKITVIFLLGFFIDCINIFMSAIALPAIALEMNVSIVSVTWVSNSYILGLTLIIPLSHWLSQRFGIRALMVSSMLLFSISVAFAGYSSTFSELIIWRFIQGISGGLIIPIGQALTFHYFQGNERSKVSTLVMAIALIAPAISPTLGGFIVDTVSWRWVFYSNIPFSLLTAFLAFIWVNEVRPQGKVAPDIKGIVFISLIIVFGLFALSAYGEYQSIVLALFSLLVATLFCILYYRHYKKASFSVINLALLKNKKLSLSIFIYYCIPGVFTGINILAIFYLQEYLKFTGQGTGLFMLLYAIGAFISIVVSGFLYNKLGMKHLFILALMLHSFGIFLLIFINSHSDILLLAIAYLIIGIGGGIGANTAQTTALYDFDSQNLVQASVIWNINRQVVFSVGATVVAMIFNLLTLFFIPQMAYHITFLICALVGVLPLTLLLVLKKKTFQQEIQNGTQS